MTETNTTTDFTAEQREEIISFVATDMMNSLPLTQIIEAVKEYAIRRANESYESATDEMKTQVLEEIKRLRAEVEGQNNQSAPS